MSPSSSTTFSGFAPPGSLSSTLPLPPFPLSTSHCPTTNPSTTPTTLELCAIDAGRHQRPNSATETPFERGGQQRSCRLTPLRGRKRAPLVGGRGVVSARVRTVGCPSRCTRISPTLQLSSLLLRPHCDGTCSVLLVLRVHANLSIFVASGTRCNIIGRGSNARGGEDRSNSRVGSRRLRRRQHASRAIHALRIYELCEQTDPLVRR